MKVRKERHISGEAKLFVDEALSQYALRELLTEHDQPL